MSIVADVGDEAGTFLLVPAPAVDPPPPSAGKSSLWMTKLES